MIGLLTVYFCLVSSMASRTKAAEKSKKAAAIISKIVAFSPIIGVAIFSFLFAFVLKGRLPERLSHAMIVFALWVYATKFYVYAISYFKKGKVLALSLAGAALSIALAVLYTPLDRYVRLIYASLGGFSFLPGLLLWGVYYADVGLKKAIK